jgi:hypothetical protein
MRLLLLNKLATMHQLTASSLCPSKEWPCMDCTLRALAASPGHVSTSTKHYARSTVHNASDGAFNPKSQCGFVQLGYREGHWYVWQGLRDILTWSCLKILVDYILIGLVSDFTSKKSLVWARVNCNSDHQRRVALPAVNQETAVRVKSESDFSSSPFKRRVQW